MARFNRTFYDLNNERRYCFEAAGVDIPPALLSDLKLSVPGFIEKPMLTGMFVSGNTVKLTIAVGGQIVASYSSENRSLLRSDRAYPLKSWREGYEGIVVFGDLKSDVRCEEDLAISEECLTRYEPSAVSYISIPCTDIRLTGEVSVGGDLTQTSTFTVQTPVGMFDVLESMVIDILDNGTPDSLNPIIFFANGVNAFNDIADIRSPIYSIAGVSPNKDGTVFVHFDTHFEIAAIVHGEEGAGGETAVSEIAVGSDITQEVICGQSDGGTGGGPIENDCPVEFVEINYA